jgi:ribosomal protein S18 acetylase RimI-like enzyme
MTPNYSVRPARAGDHAALVEFNLAMARETEGRELDRERLSRGVGAALADPERGFYRIAESEGQAAGALLVTREWSDWRNGWVWWIQSVYVAREHRRRGVYSALHAHVLREARERGDVVGVRLYVDHENAAAQATYAKLGMQRSPYVMFETQELVER